MQLNPRFPPKLRREATQVGFAGSQKECAFFSWGEIYKNLYIHASHHVVDGYTLVTGDDDAAVLAGPPSAMLAEATVAAHATEKEPQIGLHVFLPVPWSGRWRSGPR